MLSKLKTVLSGIREVMSTKWNAANLAIAPWALNSFISIVIIRSLAYGLELMLVNTADPVSQLMSFAAVMGISTWGLLMLISLAIVIAGLVFRNMVVTTIGILSCVTVWSGFSLIVCIGWISIGHNGRYAITSMCTAAVWVVLFLMHLKSIKTHGVSS